MSSALPAHQFRARHPVFLALLSLLLAAGAAAQNEPEVRAANDGNVILSGVPEVPAEISQRLEPYHSTRGSSFSGWRSDGDGLYITTRFGDVAQLHKVEFPGADPFGLTSGAEPVRSANPRPYHSEVFFTMDEGGGEFFQFFLLDPETSEYRRLTDGTSRNSTPSWSRDGAQIAYTSTRRDGRSNDVWVMAADDTASARLALRAPDGSGWGAADWSADGSHLLIGNYRSITNVTAHLLDLNTGELQVLAGDPGEEGAFVPSAFAADDSGFFLVTDQGGEFRQLAFMDLGDRSIALLTDDIPWDVEGVVFNEGRTRGAFSVNEGGISRLYLFDPTTFAFRLVESVPVGLLGGARFSADGRRLGFTLNTAATPSDVYSIELGDEALEYGELTRWTHADVGGLDTDSFVTPDLIEYPTFDGLDIPAFVYRPRGDGPHPVVIRIHGGPESQSRPGFSSLFQSWINEYGIAVLDPNVRGSAGYGSTYLGLDNAMLRENSVRDIGALLDWIATQPDLDEDRVMVYGGSYGGYMVLASLMHYGDRLRGGVNIVGISDFITFLQNTESYRRDLRRAEYGDERDPEIRAFFEEISPLRNADRITAPLFVIHGQNDPRVPVSEAEQIVAQVRANGYDVWYMNALNEGHGFSRRENQDLMRDLVVLFFEEHLLE